MNRLPPLLDRSDMVPFDRERFERRRPWMIASIVIVLAFSAGVVLGLLLGLVAAGR